MKKMNLILAAALLIVFTACKNEPAAVTDTKPVTVTKPVIPSQIINQTSFENFAVGHEYVQGSWSTDGFNPRWVNGFNQSRCFVDNAFFKTGSKSLRVRYPAGGFGPNNSGAQAPLVIPGQDQYFVSYSVYFSSNFDYGGTSEGGKLPGLASGGNCSGCATCTGNNGLTARLMWRTGGKIALYLYHLNKPSSCGEDIDLKNAQGADVFFQKSRWYTIVQRVKVNTGTNNDGEVEVWVDGDQALLRTGLRFVTNGDKIDNFYFSTFHGGNSASWAPSVDCNIWYDDIKISTLKSDMNVK